MLVNPPPYKIQEAYYDTPPYPRPALAFLAAQLKRVNADVHVLDCKYDRLGYQDAMVAVRELNPDIVGLTAFTNEIIQAARFAKLVKERDSQTVTIIGGVHVSSLPERTLREFPHFDYGVIGEGEETLLEIYQAFEQGREIGSLPGVCTLSNDGSYVSGPARGYIAADDLPVPAWDMFKPAKIYVLHTQRGCPHKCVFCANPGGHRVRSSSVETVLDEIENLVQRSGKIKIALGDEIFSLKRERTEKICRGLIERGLHKKVRWFCMVHVRSIDFALARLMKKAGCYLVGMGVESGDEQRLKLVNKGTTVQMILDAVAALKQAKLNFEGYFILGQPNETPQSARGTIDFAVKINPSKPVFGIMIPYPGTKIWEMANAAEGGYILRSTNWNDYNKQLGTALSFKDITYKQLANLQLWGYLKVFLWNFRFRDLIIIVWQYRLISFTLLVRFLKQKF